MQRFISRPGLAFLIVTLIWSCTPLAVKWTVESFTDFWAVLFRVAISWAILLVVVLYRKKLYFNRSAIGQYLTGGIGLLGTMAFVYVSANYLNSGTISILNAASPLIAAAAALFIIKQTLKLSAVVSLLMGFVAVFLIFLGEISHSTKALLGVCLCLISVCFYSIGGVILQKFSQRVDVVEQTFMSLSVVLLGVVIYGLLKQPVFSTEMINLKGVYSLIFLATFGSVVAFLLYYYLLKTVSVTTTSVMTMISPVLSLWIGFRFNGENIALLVILGTLLLILSLVVYFLPSLMKKSL